MIIDNNNNKNDNDSSKNLLIYFCNNVLIIIWCNKKVNFTIVKLFYSMNRCLKLRCRFFQ